MTYERWLEILNYNLEVSPIGLSIDDMKKRKMKIPNLKEMYEETKEIPAMAFYLMQELMDKKAIELQG